MNRNHKIDILLNTFCELKTISIAFGELYAVAFGESPQDNDKLRERLIEQDMLKEYMRKYELIDGVAGDYPGVWFKVSVRGREIYENGGWLKYLNEQKKKEKSTQVKDNRQFIITTVISVVAILFSVYQTYEASDLKNEKVKLINRIDTLKMELQQKDRLLKELKERSLGKDSLR